MQVAGYCVGNDYGNGDGGNGVGNVYGYSDYGDGGDDCYHVYGDDVDDGDIIDGDVQGDYGDWW